VDLLPKLKLEMVLPDKLVNTVVDTILRQPRQERLVTVRYFYRGLKKPSGFAMKSAAKTRSERRDDRTRPVSIRKANLIETCKVP